jgi:carbon-monoxide dehydrogenase small subunit
MKIKVTINTELREAEVPPMRRVLDLLREDFALTGSKEGCGEGECGACSILLNGTVVNSCLIPVCQINGSNIVTIEGLAKQQALHPLQRAFIEYGATQCGICIPGMVMAAWALLQNKEYPSRAEIRRAIAGNLCRCTGYMKIVDAIEAAAVMLMEQRS